MRTVKLWLDVGDKQRGRESSHLSSIVMMDCHTASQVGRGRGKAKNY